MYCFLLFLQSHQEFHPPIIGGGHTSTPHGMGGPIFRTPAKPDVSSIHMDPEILDETVEVSQEPTITKEDVERFASLEKAVAEQYKQKNVRLT